MALDDRPALRAAVIGTGTMGFGIAQLLARAGISCRIADLDLASAQAGRERAIESAKAFEQAGLFAAGASDTIATHLVAVENAAAACADAEIVFEVVSERLEIKRAVYAEVERSTSSACVIVTNTSAIPIAVLSAELTEQSRFVGAHWFNPPQWIPCVEVIAGPHTTAETIELVKSVLLRLGKRPIVVGDSAGFVANRIQFAMFKEAAAVVADGVATPAEVDEVVRASFGFRLAAFGPFAIADMAGLDVYRNAFAALEANLGPRFAAPPSLDEQVEAGRFGTKSGGGYREFPDVAGTQARRDAAYAALVALAAETGMWETS